MENSNEKLIMLLNQLTEINNDRVAGYEHAEKETNDAELKQMFNKFASQSREFRTELSSRIRLMGGNPTDGTTTSGKFYRAWMDIKAALTGKDRKAIIASCEFGEDVALGTYKQAVETDLMLKPEIRDLIQRQKNEIQMAHDTVKALRDAAHV